MPLCLAMKKRSKILDCCDLHLATSTCTIALVTIMVLVTMSGRSGRVSSFLLVRRIGCAGSHQPNPVGVGFARRMPNKMRKIHMRHRRQDRLRGVTPPSHGGNQKADLNHLGIHTTTARGACCREAVIGGVRLVDFQASPKSISHQPKHNSRDQCFLGVVRRTGESSDFLDTRTDTDPIEHKSLSRDLCPVIENNQCSPCGY